MFSTDVLRPTPYLHHHHNPLYQPQMTTATSSDSHLLLAASGSRISEDVEDEEDETNRGVSPPVMQQQQQPYNDQQPCQQQQQQPEWMRYPEDPGKPPPPQRGGEDDDDDPVEALDLRINRAVENADRFDADSIFEGGIGGNALQRREDAAAERRRARPAPYYRPPPPPPPPPPPQAPQSPPLAPRTTGEVSPHQRPQEYHINFLLRNRDWSNSSPQAHQSAFSGSTSHYGLAASAVLDKPTPMLSPISPPEPPRFTQKHHHHQHLVRGGRTSLPSPPPLVELRSGHQRSSPGFLSRRSPLYSPSQPLPHLHPNADDEASHPQSPGNRTVAAGNGGPGRLTPPITYIARLRRRSEMGEDEEEEDEDQKRRSPSPHQAHQQQGPLNSFSPYLQKVLQTMRKQRLQQEEQQQLRQHRQQQRDAAEDDLAGDSSSSSLDQRLRIIEQGVATAAGAWDLTRRRQPKQQQIHPHQIRHPPEGSRFPAASSTITGFQDQLGGPSRPRLPIHGHIQVSRSPPPPFTSSSSPAALRVPSPEEMHRNLLSYRDKRIREELFRGRDTSMVDHHHQVPSPSPPMTSLVQSHQTPSSLSSAHQQSQMKGKRGRPRKHAPKIPLPPLYVFIRNMLHNRGYNPRVIAWVNESAGVFKVSNTAEFARTWGRMKSNRSEEMNYEKMSRAMRYHYGNPRHGRKGHLAMVKEKRLVYRFGELAINWRRDEVVPGNCDLHELCRGHMCLWSKE